LGSEVSRRIKQIGEAGGKIEIQKVGKRELAGHGEKGAAEYLASESKNSKTDDLTYG